MSRGSVKSGLGCCVLAALLASGLGVAAAQSTDSGETPATEPKQAEAPVDPYARDPEAPVPPADEARGWQVRPRSSYNPAVRWVKKKTQKGAQFSLQMVFAPFEGALKLNEHFALVRRIENFFYNDERTAGFLPSVSYVTGFGPAFGASIFHKDILGDGERIAFKASYGGVYAQTYQLSADIPSFAGDRIYAEAQSRFEGKPEIFFAGLGHPPAPADPMATDLDPREAAVRTRFRERRYLAVLSTGARFGLPRPWLRAGISLIYNVRQFDPLDEDSDRISIDQAYDTSLLPGFDEGDDILEITADATLDTRDLGGKTGRGWVLDVFAGGAPSLDGNPYIHYGIEATWYVTLFRRGRVFLARGMLEGVDGDDSQIPFTELPRLGGPARLRGYRLDRFRDNLAAIGTIEYRYPIHHLASGLFFAEIGKVGIDYGELRTADDWQPGIGGGFVVHTLEDVRFRIDISYGEGWQIFFATDALAAFSGRRREL